MVEYICYYLVCSRGRLLRNTSIERIESTSIFNNPRTASTAEIAFRVLDLLLPKLMENGDQKFRPHPHSNTQPPNRINLNDEVRESSSATGLEKIQRSDRKGRTSSRRKFRFSNFSSGTTSTSTSGFRVNLKES